MTPYVNVLNSDVKIRIKKTSTFPNGEPSSRNMCTFVSIFQIEVLTREKKMVDTERKENNAS